jgi:hypothetical protein
VIVIDATQLRNAAPRVGDLYLTVLRAGKAVGALSTCGLPAGLAGRAEGVITSVSAKLSNAANALDGTADDLLRRAGLAELADQLSTLAFAAEAPGMTTGLIEAARAAGTYGVPASVGAIASRIGWAAGSLSLALNVGVPTAHDLSNPYLDEDRKVSNALARGITGGGVIVAGGIIIGVMSGALLPVAVAAGAGLAFSVLDKELGITDGLADGIDWATDQTSAAAEALGRGFSSGAESLTRGAADTGRAIGDGATAFGREASEAGRAVGRGAGKVGGAVDDGIDAVGGVIGGIL